MSLAEHVMEVNSAISPVYEELNTLEELTRRGVSNKVEECTLKCFSAQSLRGF
jgi:hypothetical protein